MISSYFKDIYLYLAQNKLPSTKLAIRKVEALAEKYTLLDSLLFKIISTPQRETAVLAIPETCADNYFVSFKFVCKTSGYNKDISNYKW